MKNKYIKDLVKNTKVEEVFLVSSYEEKVTRGGDQYISLQLADKTGIMDGKIWNGQLQACQRCKKGDVVKISGDVTEFNNGLQFKISTLEIYPNYDISDFAKTSKHQKEEILAKLESYIDQIEIPELRDFLVNNILLTEMKDKFLSHPAAKSNHHDYNGGLADHVIEMLNIANCFLESCENLNKSILFAGIILHDIGKLVELDNNITFVDYSVKGSLLGHIYLGASWFDKNTDDNFPQNVKDKIIHIILSHHGRLEYGSPVKPKTLEAIAVHQIDDLSAKLNGANKAYNNSSPANLFTERVPIIESELYTG